MSRPPLENALPAAYPSPALEPEREKILHARLDEALANARAESTYNESNKHKGKRRPIRILFRLAVIGSAIYVAQSIAATYLGSIWTSRYFLQPGGPVHEIQYKFNNGVRFKTAEYWKKVVVVEKYNIKSHHIALINTDTYQANPTIKSKPKVKHEGFWINDGMTLNQCGFVARTISFAEGCPIGQFPWLSPRRFTGDEGVAVRHPKAR